MAGRSANVIVCDEAMFSLTGKLSLHGIYPGDISITEDVVHMPQLVFYFTVATPKNDPFEWLKLKVALPDSAEVIVDVDVPLKSVETPDARSYFFVKVPLLLPSPVLKPGRIQTMAIHERGELDAGGIWVTSTAKP